ncbi:Williams-Beuren syndrome chromosomal region 27 protein-like [Plakobranchus ocellatus]|uniref:Williams-Beuren syndrome chromosomal region 27 protein-like n=1 Tax=Plakobranchus ocellatus TaxID=259542 RepID=A0AAV4AXQ1_9GAST|nr:Williams-Beuren syndrome chromosomal region 27 protein-like [Plakobranchus ocellatus]
MSRTSETAEEAEQFFQAFHKPGLGYDKCVAEYNKVVGSYTNSATAVSYRGPRYCAQMLSGLIEDITNAQVLDIAAGTGLVGQELRKKGFTHIDAHDGAESMVEYCKNTGFYENFFVSFVGDGHRLPIKDKTYDGVTCCGATVENHLPPSAQAEFIRVIKPGGFFVNAYRATLPDCEYGKNWRAEAQKLENDGKWILYGRLAFTKFNKFTDANLTQQWLQRYGWEILPHLAQSLDLAPSAFHLFGSLKRHLGGMAFETEDELISELRNWFDNLDVDFFRVGINSLLSRWQKCIHLHGDYVEK